MTTSPDVSGHTASAGLRERAERVLAPTYARDLVLRDGEGAWVTDVDGRTYLDATSGIAVNALGHRSQLVAAAIREALARPLHVSNLFHTEPAIELAELLVRHSFADRVFFTNSGTEAVEAAIKFARLHGAAEGTRQGEDNATRQGEDNATRQGEDNATRQGEDNATRQDEDTGDPAPRHEVVFAEGAFHGRTLGALAATDREDYQRPFRPLPAGYRRMRWNDVADLQRVITRRTALVLVEPVQGEGGVRVADPEWLRAMGARCREVGALFGVDEIQCGLGRTGRLWAIEHADITPDLLTAAKPLANGLPVGAVLMTDTVAASLHPGCHGSTFAGGPLVTTVAGSVLRAIAAPSFLARVNAAAVRLRDGLEELVHEYPRVHEVRGLGLLLGVAVTPPVGDLIAAAREAGLLLVPAAGDVARVLPPLTVSDDDLDLMVARLRTALDTLGAPT